MNSPSIAVVLPTCNRLGMLKRTLRSLEAQTFKDFVVYISDDASKDDTRLLGSGDFPNLNVQVARRLTSFPTLMDHFTYLFYSVKEEIVAMAHDDEVYHPDWLSTLIPAFSDPEVVFAYGQTVSVDAKTQEKIFYNDENQIMKGVFGSQEFKNLVVQGRIYLPGNGFAVRTQALAKVGPFLPTYEQFDYEWMMRLAGQGKTEIFPQLLASYTIHSSNTVGSRKYLERLLHQKSANHMYEEWLRDLTNLEPAERAKLAARLEIGQAGLEWMCFIRALGYGEMGLSETYGARVLAHPRSTLKEKAFVRVASMPALRPAASKLLSYILRHRARSRMRQRALSPIEKSDALRRFPTLALFDQPLS